MEPVWQNMITVLHSPLALLGLFGQVLFFGRWIMQWLASERIGSSHVPLSFWWISFAGGALLLIYALLRHDPIFVMGQLVGLLNYGRNIYLVDREKRSLKLPQYNLSQ